LIWPHGAAIGADGVAPSRNSPHSLLPLIRPILRRPTKLKKPWQTIRVRAPLIGFTAGCRWKWDRELHSIRRSTRLIALKMSEAKVTHVWFRFRPVKVRDMSPVVFLSVQYCPSRRRGLPSTIWRAAAPLLMALRSRTVAFGWLIYV